MYIPYVYSVYHSSYVYIMYILYNLPVPLQTVPVALLDSAQLPEVGGNLAHSEGTQQTSAGCGSCFGCPVQLCVYCFVIACWK